MNNNASVFFIIPDLFKAPVVKLDIDYHVICAYPENISNFWERKGRKVFCLEKVLGKEALSLNNSGKILALPQVLQYIRENSNGPSFIMNFKPSEKMDMLINKLGFTRIGNRAELALSIEDKVSSFKIFNPVIERYYPDSITGIFGNIEYNIISKKLSDEFIVQFGKGWAGKGTYKIKDKGFFEQLKNKRPFTRVRLSRYIDGVTYTINAVIWRGKVYSSTPAVQINGFAFLSDNDFATCGRQWPATGLDRDDLKSAKGLVTAIGRKLIEIGYKGYFGIDFIKSRTNGKVYFLEINPRLTASSSFYENMEKKQAVSSLLDYHIASFVSSIEVPSNYKAPDIIGSQVKLRKRSKRFLSRHRFPYAVYGMREGNKSLVSKNYIEAGKLKSGEYSVFNRSQNCIMDSGNNEGFADIETGEKVLREDNKFENWFADLF